MKELTISDVRKNFAAVVDSVIDDSEECVIPRGGGQAVVILSLDEWNSMKETLHVLGTRTNARRLLESLDELDAAAAASSTTQSPVNRRRPIRKRREPQGRIFSERVGGLRALDASMLRPLQRQVRHGPAATSATV